VLTEQDILSAPEHAPSAALQRPVGAARHMGMMAKTPAMGMGGGRRSGMSAYM